MTAEERALVVLDLRPPVTIAIVKMRYKELVKLHHPDANGGDKASEERFKQISEAYRTVMNSSDAMSIESAPSGGGRCNVLTTAKS